MPLAYSLKVLLYDDHDVLDVVQEELSQSFQSTLLEEGQTHPLTSCLPGLRRMPVYVHNNHIGHVYSRLR